MDPIKRRLESAPTDPLLRVARTATLLDEGLGRSRLATLLRKDWHCVHHGVVVIGDTAVQDLACLAQAALLALGPAAQISHVTAARLWEVPGADGLPGIWMPGDQIDVTVPPTLSPKPQKGVRIHRLPTPPPMKRNGIRIASPSRTLQDLLVSEPLEMSVAALEGAVHRRLLPSQLIEKMAHEIDGRRGCEAARRALRRVWLGAESTLESISRLRFEDIGLRPDELQPVVRDLAGSFVARPDMSFKGRRRTVYGEADGVSTHSGREMRRDDSVREELIRLTGAEVVRWDWKDMLHAMPHVAQRIRRFRDM